MADADFAAGKPGDKPGPRRRGWRARRAPAAPTSDGPWQWGWRRQHRRGRRMGCLLWLLTLLIVFVVLSLLFGGFQKGSKVGGSGPAGRP